MRVEDLDVTPFGDGTIMIRRSKTDQTGQGMTRYLRSETVALLHEWLTLARIHEGPIFRAMLRWDRIDGPLKPAAVSDIFKEMAERAGLPPDVVRRVSGHSTRVGAAIDMASSGEIGSTEIMQAGGWKSMQMVARYTAKIEARHGAAAKLARLQSRK